MREAWTAWLGWLHATPLALAMRQSEWLYPTVEILHILGFCALVGAAALFDLRLLGVSRQIPVQQMAAHLLPVAWAGFALAAPSGFLLLLSDAKSIGVSPIFLSKLALIGLAGVNALIFHTRTARGLQAWNQHVHPPLAAKLNALFSLGVWTAVIALGRLIAYYG
ncbi:hypothetical protein [Meiothermus taiwanensis]|jgi:hypothetical protein|uniref:DUF2214 domain-containing protein n=1 Tax=Meiothermus taiwanensis TaxID=172827 RepID=A0A399E7A4_9DEIN|nr:hypothetical protein [Meiothermus taiwanensis]KIQ55408.1 hypothetical protein SY28_03715 [Meiothermus taiwanensis]KZK16619.1 hypothetical protein A3962_05465 [Meiothermus taiwanensis]RIH79756.1 hypothetical protein Mcate_00193 [Meiothermus taiwanensis]